MFFCYKYIALKTGRESDLSNMPDDKDSLSKIQKIRKKYFLKYAAPPCLPVCQIFTKAFFVEVSNQLLYLASVHVQINRFLPSKGICI